MKTADKVAIAIEVDNTESIAYSFFIPNLRTEELIDKDIIGSNNELSVIIKSETPNSALVKYLV